MCNLNKPFNQKVLYFVIDTFHCMVYIFMFYLFWNPYFDLLQLSVHNILYLVIVTYFYFNKRCMLTIIAEESIELKEHRCWIGPFERIYYFVTEEKYYPKNQENMDN